METGTDTIRGHNLVAVYNTLADAQRVRARLISEGIPASDIRLSSAQDGTADTPRTQEQPGFWAWLFGDVPDDDREAYASYLREKREIVSVWVENQAEHMKVVRLMDEYNPIDIGPERVGSTGIGGTETDVTRPDPLRAAMPVGGRHGMTETEREQVIPVAKEELDVGKRVEEKRYRVRVHQIERPVSETINLRDERVEVERRPAARDLRPGELQGDRTIDVVERHEEPVASKTGRVTEEVVVRKEQTEHPETVRGTVQETQVDVERPDAAKLDPADRPIPKAEGASEPGSTARPERPTPKNRM